MAEPKANFFHGPPNLRKRSSSQFIMRVKYSDTKPQKIPSRITYGMRPMPKSSVCTKLNSAPEPVKTYDTVTAVIDDMSSGSTDVVVRSTINTSSVKSIPAIGALNIPAIAAAAPHPTMSMSICGGILKRLPILEPMAAPVYTIGASAPTEPPNPIVTELATIEVYILWGFTRLFFCEMA